MEIITKEELRAYLDEIISCEAFEFHKSVDSGGKESFYIPYMMNDALECYLMLSDGHMTGAYRQELEVPVTADFMETEEGPAIIFRQGIENVFTVWYGRCFRVLACYRYDQIGHFWVKGEEHWRRLVYIVGTIYDKFNYMGEAVCNEKEQALIPLMEFAPFRFFSPIHESLDSYYEESADGFACMKALAEEANDREFLCLMHLYSRFPFKRQMRKYLVRAMQSPKRNKLYQLIFDKVHDASSEYPERTYPDGLHEKIKTMRTEVQQQLHEAGFTGYYPLFHKDNLQVMAMEEHPFTILESEHYGFRVQYMVSEIESKDRSEHLLNPGFFRKKGRRGWITGNCSF